MLYSRRHALSLAKQFRTCPPAHVLKASIANGEARTHLNLCPYCASRDPKEENAWDRLAEGAAGLLTSAQTKSKEAEIRSGSLCPVAPGLAGWREGLYYNPPVVLVLHPVALSRGVSAWRVAQTCHDTLLAAPGDLILPPEMSPLGEIFVEPWNTYTLRSRDLSSPIGQVGSEVVGAVIALEIHPSDCPPWAPAPKPLDQNDPRISFREMEVEVGYTFSSRAVAGLMARVEVPELRLVYASTVELQKAMKGKAAGLRWPVAPADLEQALTLARFPDAYLPKAAQDSTGEIAAGNMAVFEEGVLKELVPLQVKIMGQEGGLKISGVVLEMPGPLTGTRFLCHFVAQSGRVFSPRQVDWDGEAGHFVAEFDTEGEVKGRVSMSLIRETFC